MSSTDEQDHAQLCFLFGLLGSILNSLERHSDAAAALREAFDHELHVCGSRIEANPSSSNNQWASAVNVFAAPWQERGQHFKEVAARLSDHLAPQRAGIRHLVEAPSTSRRRSGEGLIEQLIGTDVEPYRETRQWRIHQRSPAR